MSVEQYIRVIDRDAVRDAQVNGYLFEQLLPRKGVALLVGHSGVGKSFLSLLMATSLATGERVAHPAPDDGDSTGFARAAVLGATLYIAGEGIEGLPDRIAVYEQRVDVCGDDNYKRRRLPIIPMAIAQSRLVGAEQVFSLLKMASDKIALGETGGLPVRLIVFDTLISTFDIRDENSNSEMQSVVSALRKYAEKFDCLVLAVVHPGKGRGGRRGVRGASALPNAADAVLSLDKVKDTRRRLTVVKLRDSRGEGGSYDYELVATGTSAVMVPIARLGSESKQLLRDTSTRAMEVLNLIEMACEESTVVVDNFVGLRVRAANLAQIERKWTALETERALGDQSKVAKPNTLRKRAERELPALLAGALVEKIISHDVAYYVATSSWIAPSADR